MTQHTHQTAPTQFVEANGIRFAYRRFGKAGGVPLVFNQHFTGTMDHWDPAETDGLAQEREVILNAGVSSSSGEVPTTFEEMAANAVAFIKALGLKQVDVLGFSIGGFVAQEITLQAPELVRRLVLLGTGPSGRPHCGTETAVGACLSRSLDACLRRRVSCHHDRLRNRNFLGASVAQYRCNQAGERSVTLKEAP
jgi:pimeloyl-ACP methyl ester carboxylesterase